MGRSFGEIFPPLSCRPTGSPAIHCQQRLGSGGATMDRGAGPGPLLGGLHHAGRAPGSTRHNAARSRDAIGRAGRNRTGPATRGPRNCPRISPEPLKILRNVWLVTINIGETHNQPLPALFRHHVRAEVAEFADCLNLDHGNIWLHHPDLFDCEVLMATQPGCMQLYQTRLCSGINRKLNRSILLPVSREDSSFWRLDG